MVKVSKIPLVLIAACLAACLPSLSSSRRPAEIERELEAERELARATGPLLRRLNDQLKGGEILLRRAKLRREVLLRRAGLTIRAQRVSRPCIEYAARRGPNDRIMRSDALLKEWWASELDRCSKDAIGVEIFGAIQDSRFNLGRTDTSGRLSIDLSAIPNLGTIRSPVLTVYTAGSPGSIALDLSRWARHLKALAEQRAAKDAALRAEEQRARDQRSQALQRWGLQGCDALGGKIAGKVIVTETPTRLVLQFPREEAQLQLRVGGVAQLKAIGAGIVLKDWCDTGKMRWVELVDQYGGKIVRCRVENPDASTLRTAVPCR